MAGRRKTVTNALLTKVLTMKGSVSSSLHSIAEGSIMRTENKKTKPNVFHLGYLHSQGLRGDSLCFKTFNFIMMDFRAKKIIFKKNLERLKLGMNTNIFLRKLKVS